MNRGDACEVSRIRRVQLLNSIREVLFGSGTFHKPFHGKKDRKDENDREHGRQQTDKPHAGRAFSVDRPDQTNTYNKQQNKGAHPKADIGVFGIFA